MANIFISFQREFYYGGDTVQAAVYLNLFENIMGSNEITIKLKGWESIKWYQELAVDSKQKQKITPNEISPSTPSLSMGSSDSDDGNYNNQAQPIYVNDNKTLKRKNMTVFRRQIIKAQELLYKFDNNFMPAGQYVFPVTFKTGEKFPATYADKQVQKNRRGRVKYELQVFIRSFNTQRKVYKFKQEMVIRQTVPLKNNQEQVSVHLKSCCSDKGTTKIQSYFLKNGYLPGENAVINCIVDNTAGKSELKSLNATLINEIMYLGSETSKQTFKEVIFKQKLPGVKAGEKSETQHQISIDNSYVGANYVLKSSSRGAKILSNFYLLIQPIIDGNDEATKIKLPIDIYSSIRIDNLFRSPPNWSPKVFPIRHLSFGFQISVVKQNLVPNQMGGMTFGLGFSNASTLGLSKKKIQGMQTPKKTNNNQYVPVSYSNMSAHTTPPKGNQNYLQGNNNFVNEPSINSPYNNRQL